ncbi:cellulase family glycosylhydrolase [Myceligenerans pegani]|uniref:Cellulase family glycosylhydrolase n=1 Tax=Myceligenerans pegani TaxID=2776917 RepID=A0ABR9MV59_9MICO|nr:cellulase family glycosylhydrolase [Myceligenerans sp. TRM 65318]MBE1875279.1 cellulase family glycosylhydrolase [Myceligenerans sp. TRM 65318]MBE3017550.1 cellulase family glycosylhydrolase [Myceligenerans sp. TRM 65318]
MTVKRSPGKRLAAVVAGLALSVSLTTPAGAQATPEQRSSAMPTSAAEVVAAMQPGWNLGNSFDAQCCGEGGETAWGNPRVDDTFFEDIKAEGFNSVRIPVSWGSDTGPAPDYVVDPEVMERVREVVDLALDADLYVMINMHHDSWQWVKDMPTRRDEVMAQYDATWTQIANTFRDHPGELVFESINEQTFEGSSGDAEDHRHMAELNGSFHEIVRSSGGNNADRLLVLPTLHTGAEQVHMDALAAEIEALDDPMLAATTHNYSFWPFSVNIAGYTTYDDEVRALLEETFQSQVDTFVSQGIPVIIGEYGLLDGYDVKVERGEVMKFFEHFGHLARTTGITTMWWDNGTHFDRFMREWRDEKQFDYISSGWTTRSGTASTDLVFVDASGRVKDRSVTLNPNGLEFTDVYFGNIRLKERRDYRVDGTTLTLRKRVLRYILGDREPGTTAQLEVRFSGGVPWTLNVISSEEPVLEDASGTTDSLLIPTAFHGDRLATMEAVYADGTNAGPHDWTSYKEFWTAFKPDYEDGTIELPKAFFDAVDDDAPVTLTFHFWSGETLQYTVTRDGTAVTGTA